MQSPTWSCLPTEMKHAVLEQLGSTDINVLSSLNQEMYSLCVPFTFQNVRLHSYATLRAFLDHVPRNYCSHIQHLEVCTEGSAQVSGSDSLHPRTDALLSLLTGCTRLETLSLKLSGSLEKKIIHGFSHLSDLKQLSIANCGHEETMPISERLVVSIAASIPGLEELSLDQITRSMIHATEMFGAFPYIPVALGDQDIPDHPLLGADLSLPSLLRLPTLRKLTIRDTHLGDPRWATTDVACRLEMLDLGSCYHESDDFNRSCTERIMAAVGPTIDEFSLNTSVSSAIFKESAVTPLKRLRKLHIAPFFPVDSFVDTVTALAGSPIESLSMQCFEDDVVDVCEAVEEFLNMRVERGPEFYGKLTRIDVSVTNGEMPCTNSEEDSSRVEAVQRLQELCLDLRLASEVADGKRVHSTQDHVEKYTIRPAMPALRPFRGSW